MNSIPFGGKGNQESPGSHPGPSKTTGNGNSTSANFSRRIDQFNGQRIVSVVTDDKTDPVDDVRRAFRGTVKDFHDVPERARRWGRQSALHRPTS